MQWHLPLPFTDQALLLTPRWAELRQPYQALVLAVVALVPLALVVLYRYELRLVRRSVALPLLVLRLAVLALLLAVALLQPVMARSLTEELPGRVLIAVDRSASMDVTDPQMPPADKLRLARALHLAADVCLDAQLDAWARQYADKGQPQWVAEDEAAGDPARRARLAAERRRQHDEVCRRIDRLTRADVGRKLLAPEGLNLLATIAARHKVELIGFARDAWDAAPDGLDEFYRRPAGAPAKSADATDLAVPLARAIERSGPNAERVLGVVLLTDGRHNAGPSPVVKAAELGERDLPVFPVTVGARQAPPDVALVGVRAPPAVFKGVDTQVEARFKVGGLPRQEIVVELQRPGEPPLRESIRHDGTDRYHTVRFHVRLDQVGTQTLHVAALPVANEARTDNNGRPVVVNVADDKAKVLLIDGEARWEYHYLASALARDRAMALTSVVFAQPRLGRISEDELQRFGNPRLGLPAEPDALAGYDCIILGDVAPGQLPPADRLRLEKYVADRGGTLVLLAGKRSMPLAFAEAAEGDPIAKLLPVTEPQTVHPEDGFALALTHEGTGTPFLQMDAAPDKSREAWASLPRHTWGVVGRAKPGATPLAYLPPDPADGAAAGKPNAERDRALIVRQNYGFGRVLFVGLESTWRWRFKAGDAYHHRFWGQVVRWAASDKPLVAGNAHVRFGTREPVYAQGQEVELVVRLADDVRPPAPGALAGARLLRVDGARAEAVAVVPLARRDAQPRVLEGRVRDLPPGRYAVELAIPELAGFFDVPGGRSGKPPALFAVTPVASEEMTDLATNWPLLDELAARSGGRVFAPADAAGLVELLRRKAIVREEHTETRSWEWWPTLALFLLFVTAEWVGRKLAGLP